MSFFSLFGNKSTRAAETLQKQLGSDQKGDTQPASPAGDRKSVRLGQRELLYGVVRDVMIRAGVLVASYRFKVLSLDAQGRQYLIMMDLLKVDEGDMKRLGEMESMIVQVAKVRHDIQVTGVYWRNELQNTKPNQTQKPGARVLAPTSRDRRPSPTFEELQRSQIKPLKPRDIRSKDQKVSDNSSISSRKNSGAPSLDFEDTRIIEQREYGSQLSATQYGDLE